jgi:hypothetical protein
MRPTLLSTRTEKSGTSLCFFPAVSYHVGRTQSLRLRDRTSDAQVGLEIEMKSADRKRRPVIESRTGYRF